ncbi:hypothetical protein EUX98_g204 [Antrodiella citrinella]|uniref:Chromo domain-containing protein n=1 Tax=Antrodiella citrinella TaxID=2447956 RepID=A0A4S4N4I3_9APHY|nr:hypothetical protein EUX98_g204 [Antrodiella citrinella]
MGQEYVVERILRARVKKVRNKKVWEYFVKWAGYGESDNTWEATTSFSNGSEHFIEAFWERITEFKQEDIKTYDVGAEALPTGPPPSGKTAKKPKLEPAKLAGPSLFEPIEDSENEVRSIIGDDVPTSTSSRKRRAVSPAGEDVPSKRTRRKSARAAAASPPKKSTKRSTPTRTQSSASSSKANESSHKKPPAASRFALVGHESSVVGETTNDGASDLDNAFDMMKNAAEPPIVGPSRLDEQDDPMVMDGPSTFRTVVSPSIQSRHEAVARPEAISVRPIDVQPPSGLIARARAMKGSIMGLFTQESSSSIKRSDKDAEAGPSRRGPPIVVPPDSSPLASSESVKKAGSELHDEDAEGEIDDEHVPDTQMDGDIASPAETVRNVSSSRALTALRNTIFGPLGFGQNLSPSGSSENDERPMCLIKLSYTVTLPLLLSHMHPPSNTDYKPLGEAVAGSVSQTPGKFYPRQHALALANALVLRGSCAQGILDDKATSDDDAHFQRFKAKLMKGDLFVTTIGSHVLALCSSTNNTIGTKLGIKPELLSTEGNVVVSEVVIADDVAYCDAVMHADGEQW